jgi:hypothetical protein
MAFCKPFPFFMNSRALVYIPTYSHFSFLLTTLAMSTSAPKYMYLVIREATEVPNGTAVSSSVYNEHKLKPIITAVFHTIAAARSSLDVLCVTTTKAGLHGTPFQESAGYNVLEGQAYVEGNDGEVKQTIFIERVVVGVELADLEV